MPKALFDNRNYKAMTVEQADALFREIALITVRINRVKANYEKKIADLKTAAELTLGPDEAELERLSQELRNYIQSNPERFIRPRQHLTDYGKYGVRTAVKLEITDEETVKNEVRRQGIPALTLIEHLDRKALEKAISEGKTIAGCELCRGEIASYTVSKALLED